MEEVVYDRDTGQILTGSFTDYAMPRAHDFCYFDVDRHPIPTKTNPLGVKGAAESGVIAAPAAIVSAVEDALRDYELHIRDLPLTRERIMAALLKT